MRILLVGGGSGGHVTPLKAVAKELRLLEVDAKISVLTDRKFSEQTSKVFSDSPEIAVKKIYAGKLRRYNTKSFLWHVLHLPTVLRNAIDVMKLLVGTLQLVVYFITNKPDVVFCKGGFVSVPAGLVARLFGVPMLLHDSDTHPGLSSRIISSWAQKIATGMPTKYYPYPSEKTVYTGIPVDSRYQPVSAKQQKKKKEALGFDASMKLLLVTGGGTGAESLNKAVCRVAEELIGQNWQIAHITGKGKSSDVRAAHDSLESGVGERWQVHEFVDMHDFIEAADIVITRAGATIMQELANAEKIAILVPSRFLSGGHQLKNAQMYKDSGAAIVVNDEILEEQPDLLVQAVESIDSLPEKGIQYARFLHRLFSKPDAAKTIAVEILAQVKH